MKRAGLPPVLDTVFASIRCGIAHVPLMFHAAHPLAPVILIDDNDDDLFLLQRLLSRAGLQNPVRAFRGSVEALAHLQALNAAVTPADFPSAIVLDGNMPQLDGFALLRALRALPAYAELRMVMVSSSAREEDRDRAIAAGADAYLVKFPSTERFAEVLEGAAVVTA